MMQATKASQKHSLAFVQQLDQNKNQLLQHIKDSLNLDTVTLDLQNLHFNDEDLADLIPHIQALAKLESLNLSHNYLHYLISNIFFKANQFFLLTKLNLSHNMLSCSSMNHLASWLMQQETLRELDLSHNRINSRSLSLFAEALRRNQSIINLDLSGNPITANGGQILAEGLKKHLSLETLKIDQASLHDRGMQSICNAIRFLPSLKYLSLKHNGFHSTAWIDLSLVIGSCKSLIEVDLSENIWHPEFGKLFQLALQYLKELKTLNLKHCEIDNLSCARIIEAFHRIQTFNCDDNPIFPITTRLQEAILSNLHLTKLIGIPWRYQAHLATRNRIIQKALYLLEHYHENHQLMLKTHMVLLEKLELIAHYPQIHHYQTKELLDNLIKIYRILTFPWLCLYQNTKEFHQLLQYRTWQTITEKILFDVLMFLENIREQLNPLYHEEYHHLFIQLFKPCYRHQDFKLWLVIVAQRLLNSHIDTSIASVSNFKNITLLSNQELSTHPRPSDFAFAGHDVILINTWAWLCLHWTPQDIPKSIYLDFLLLSKQTRQLILSTWESFESEKITLDLRLNVLCRIFEPKFCQQDIKKLTVHAKKCISNFFSNTQTTEISPYLNIVANSK